MNIENAKQKVEDTEQEAKEIKIPKRKYKNRCSKCGIALDSDKHEGCDVCGKLKCPVCGVCSPDCANSTYQYFGSYF